MMSDLKANSMYWYNSLMFMFIVLYKVIISGRKKYLYSLYWFQNWILVIIQLEGLISCQASHYPSWTSYQMPSKLFYKQVQQTRWNQQISNIVEEINHIQIRPRIILNRKKKIVLARWHSDVKWIKPCLWNGKGSRHTATVNGWQRQ